MRELEAGWYWTTLRNVSKGPGEYGAGLSGIPYSDDLYRYIRITDVNDDGSLNFGNPKSLKIDEGQEFDLDQGDIIFARSGATVGKTYLHDGSFPAAFAGYMVRFKIDNDKANPKFVFAWTQLCEYRKWIFSMMRAGAQPNINAVEFGKMPIALPPLTEQEQIAEILSDADAAIATAEKARDKHALHFRGLLKTIFAAENTKGWKLTALRSLGHFIRGKGIPKEHITQGDGFPCIRYAEIYTSYDDVVENFVSRVSDENAKEALALRQGDIIFPTSGETAEEIGKAVAYLGVETAYAGGDTLVLRGHGQNSAYLAYALNDWQAAKQKARFSSGQSVVHLYASELGKVSVWLPPLYEQEQIALTLECCRQHMETHDNLIAALKKQKRGLMQQLLTGKMRMPEKQGKET